jgi:hypothetical protein
MLQFYEILKSTPGTELIIRVKNFTVLPVFVKKLPICDWSGIVMGGLDRRVASDRIPIERSPVSQPRSTTAPLFTKAMT